MAQQPDNKWKLRHEMRMRRKVQGILKKQRLWLEGKIESFSFLETNSVDSEIELILSQIPHKEELAEEIVAFMKIAINRGGKTIVKDMKMKSKFGIDFDITNPKATQFLEEKFDWEFSNMKGNIDGTTKAGIKKILVDAADTGKSYNETSKLIQAQGKAGVFSKARAQMIAVREIGVAYEEGNAEVMSDFRFKYPTRQTLKKWQTVNDSRVTATHRTNQAMGWIDYTMRFDGTGDSHAPGSDNPRCRCFTKYKIPAVKK